MHKEIGGYFQLELSNKGSFMHDNGVLLNSGRNALEYILRAKGNISRLWIPYYTCDTVLEPLVKLNLPYSFYSIDEQLELQKLIELQQGEYILYTNYFGVKDRYVHYLSEQYGSQLVVDNAQALYAEVIKGISTLYSPRKFVGIPDGGIAYEDLPLERQVYELDKSYCRCGHLLRRYDEPASDGYIDFRANSGQLVMQPVREMSLLTRALLSNIDFIQVRERRLKNFAYLHKHLGTSNLLDLNIPFFCPMVYPYRMREGADIRKKLIADKIYVATYWPNVFQWCASDALECRLADDILPLPIDQRYGSCDMERILNVINN